MRRRLIGLTVVGLVALGIWLGGKFNFGFFGSGEGGTGREGVQTSVSETTKPSSADPVIENGVLRVRIDGQTIFAGGKKTSVDQIVRLAAEKDAKVSIERGDDARRRAREELEQALRDRNIHVVIE